MLWQVFVLQPCHQMYLWELLNSKRRNPMQKPFSQHICPWQEGRELISCRNLKRMQFMNCLVSKGKVVPEHPMMKLGKGGTAQLICNSALGEGERSALHPGCFSAGERASGTYQMRGRVGRASLAPLERRQIPCSTQELNHSFSDAQP